MKRRESRAFRKRAESAAGDFLQWEKRRTSKSKEETTPEAFKWRAHFLFALLVCGAAGLVYRAVNLQLVDHGFLSSQGDEVDIYEGAAWGR